jgi:iron complex outermembrane receptor protein
MPSEHTTIKKTIISVAIGAASLQGIDQATAATLEEVIVTAQKREQTLQEVPASVSAFNENFILRSNVGDIRGLTDLTPGFNGKTEDSFIDAMAMRGIVTNDFGIGGDPSVAIFQDGVWAGRNGGVQSSFYDIARVEVVKGPQATLFGRNAIAGAVSIITNRPSEIFEARLSGTVAEYDHFEGTATVNLPINDDWFFRGSVYGLTNDGYLDNIQGGDDLGYHENYSVRGALRYAGEKLDVTGTLTYENREQDPSVYWDPSAGLPEDKVNTDLGDDGFDESEMTFLTVNAEYELSDAYSISSITGYKDSDFQYLEDYDAGPERVNDYFQDNDIEFFSQEFRINYDAGGDVVWFAGASYYSEDIDGAFDFIYDEDALCRAIGRTDSPDFSGPVSGCDDPNFEEYWEEDIDPDDILTDKPERSFNDVDSEGWAVYGDITWSVTEKLDLTAGIRYTYDEKEMSTSVLDSGGALGNNFSWEYFTDGFVSDKDDWDEVTPRFAVNYDLNEAISLYASYSEGYKSGGFGTFGLELPDDLDDAGLVPPGTLPSKFDPETSDSYEAGAKMRLLDGAMQLNAAYYFYTYEDLQLIFFDEGSQIVRNLGEAENQGVEIDMHWLPTDNLDIFAALSWMDSEITDADDTIAAGACEDCDGQELPFAPEWSGAVHVTYTHPMGNGDAFVKAEYAYQDTMYSDLDNIDAIAVDSWGEWNFRAGYESQAGWDVTLWVENAFDEEYFERGWANADTENMYGYGLVNTLVWPTKPRTVGLTASMTW